MRKATFVAIIATIILAACSALPQSGSPESAIATAIEQTQVALATITPTPLSLDDLDLEPLLIQSGDLPSGFSGAQVLQDAPGMFRDIPPTENVIYQRFQKNGETIGGVTVFLYGDDETRGAAYDLVVDGFADPVEEISNVGEIADGSLFDLAFIRCNALVHVRMVGAGLDEVAAYATRLDSRLTDVVCDN
jgi:hypothetical protein